MGSGCLSGVAIGCRRLTHLQGPPPLSTHQAHYVPHPLQALGVADALNDLLVLITYEGVSPSFHITFCCLLCIFSGGKEATTRSGWAQRKCSVAASGIFHGNMGKLWPFKMLPASV